jgi:hypothetical protein
LIQPRPCGGEIVERLDLNSSGRHYREHLTKSVRELIGHNDRASDTRQLVHGGSIQLSKSAQTFDADFIFLDGDKIHQFPETRFHLLVMNKTDVMLYAILGGQASLPMRINERTIRTDTVMNWHTKPHIASLSGVLAQAGDEVYFHAALHR